MSPQRTQRKEEQASGQRNMEQHSRPRVHVPERRPLITALAAAGIAGPVIFAVVALALGLLRPGYSFVADPVVKLVTGPHPNADLFRSSQELVGLQSLSF